MHTVLLRLLACRTSHLASHIDTNPAHLLSCPTLSLSCACCPQSQFIVVSLKEGMFNNANVIFRTKFVDGVSTVTRTVNDSASSGRQGENAGRPTAGKGASKAAASRGALRDSNRC
jgi:hypothetical protein